MLAATLAGIALAAAPAAEAKGAGTFIEAGAEISPPRGFQEMCRVDDRFCGQDATEIPPAIAAPETGPIARLWRIPVLAGLATISISHAQARANAASPNEARIPPAATDVREAQLPVASMASAASTFAAGLLARPAFQASEREIRSLGRMRLIEDADLVRVTVPTISDALRPAPVEAVPGVAAAVPDEAKLLKKVNRYVNGHVHQRIDAQVYGVDERWRQSGIGRGAQGDCEDLAIEKRAQLIAAGFAADRLAFAVVYRRDIGLHTVLIARTARGDMVLDSRTPYIRSWVEAGYSWVGMQSMRDPSRWHSIIRANRTAGKVQPKYRTAA